MMMGLVCFIHFYFFFFQIRAGIKFFVTFIVALRKITFFFFFFYVPNLVTVSIGLLSRRDILRLYVLLQPFWTFSYCHVLDVLYSVLDRAKYYYTIRTATLCYIPFIGSRRMILIRFFFFILLTQNS